MMQKVIMLRGLPCSGKTTWANEQVNQARSKYIRISLKDILNLLFAGKFTKSTELYSKSVRDMLLAQALEADKFVILDDYNLDPNSEEEIRQQILLYIENHNTKIELEIKEFEIELDKAIALDLARPNSLGERAIKKMYDTFLAPKPEKIKQNKNLTKAILVDIDGTIADLGHRSPYDYKHISWDKAKKEIITLVKNMKNAGYEVIFVTGREHSAKDDTIAWICKNFEWFAEDFIIFTRENKDFRKDAVIKKEIFENNIRNNYFIEFVLDDRDQVVEMWRKELGLVCLQVNYGDF